MCWDKSCEFRSVIMLASFGLYGSELCHRSPKSLGCLCQLQMLCQPGSAHVFRLFLLFKSDRLWNSGVLGLFPNLVHLWIVLDTGHIILFLTSHESLLLGETGRPAFLLNVTSGVLVFFFTWFEAFLLWFWFFSQSK